jgi:hypothetical protein
MTLSDVAPTVAVEVCDYKGVELVRKELVERTPPGRVTV